MRSSRAAALLPALRSTHGDVDCVTSHRALTPFQYEYKGGNFVGNPLPFDVAPLLVLVFTLPGVLSTPIQKFFLPTMTGRYRHATSGNVSALLRAIGVLPLTLLL